jgi:hypothetical protein
MNLIKHPNASLAAAIAYLNQSSYGIDQTISSVITSTVFPIFLSFELIFKQLPQYLSSCLFSDDIAQKNSFEKVEKLAKSILFSPSSIFEPLEVVEAFMSLEDQKFLIEENWVALKWASKEVKNDSHTILRAIEQNVESLSFASDDLKNDRDFLIEAVRVNPSVLRYASHGLRNDKEFMKRAVKISGDALMYASEDILNNWPFIFRAFEYQRRLLNFLPSRLLQNQEFHSAFNLELVKRNGLVLRELSPSFRNDIIIVSAAVEQNGMALAYASEDLKNNRSIVLKAVKNNGSALSFASKSLKLDRTIVLQALEQDGMALMFADESFRNDELIVLKAVTKCGAAIEFAAPQLRCRKKILLEAIKQDISVLKNYRYALEDDAIFLLESIKSRSEVFIHACKALKANPRFILDAIMINPEVLRHAIPYIKENPKFLLEVLKSNCRAFLYLPDALKNNQSFLLEAIEQDTQVLQFISDDFRESRDFILEAIKISSKSLKYASKELKKDKELVLVALKKDGLALEYVDDSLKDDEELIFTAISQNGRALQFILTSKRNDQKIALNAIRQNSLAFQYLPSDLKCNPDIALEAIKKEASVLEYVPDILKSQKSFLLKAIRLNFRVFHELPKKYQDDLGIEQAFLFANIPQKLSLINGSSYFPKPLNPALKDLQLPELSSDISLESLEKKLIEFIDAISLKELMVVKKELQLDSSYDIRMCKSILYGYCQTLFKRVKNKEAYIGTPSEGTQALINFYENIECHLKHLDYFFSKEENQFPNALIERLQLLQTQGACGARFQAEVEQLFSMNCIPIQTMMFDKQLALIASSEAKKIIQSMVPEFDIHQINLLSWHLDAYLVGPKMVKDRLATPINKRSLIKNFLLRHSAVNIVNVMQKALKSGSELESIFFEYIRENFNYTFTKEDDQELSKQALDTWLLNVESKISSLKKFQEYNRSQGPYKHIENKATVIAILRLSQEEASCNSEDELLSLLDCFKEERLKAIEINARESFASEKLYDQFYDRENLHWNETIIALVLEKIGVLVAY